jgi:hypothetical protein
MTLGQRNDNPAIQPRTKHMCFNLFFKPNADSPTPTLRFNQAPSTCFFNLRFTSVSLRFDQAPSTKHQAPRSAQAPVFQPAFFTAFLNHQEVQCNSSSNFHRMQSSWN